MKTKTIEKILNKKINAWIATIKDPIVAELASKNTIVTGGSIASMLLNEKVNDFDVYFRNKQTVRALAKYYTKDFSNVKVVDGANIGELKEFQEATGVNIEDQDDQWSTFTKDLTADRIKIFVKGVNYFSVTGEGSLMAEQDEVEQTQGMFESIETARELVEVGSYKPLFFTANAITLSDQVQLVIRFHGEPWKLHENYDFVHATNYYDHETGRVTVSEAALESLLTKELRYVGSLYPVTSIIRSKKFIKRGWSITAGEYLKIMFQISELDLKDPAVLESQLIGIDVAFFSILLEAIQNRDTTKHHTVTYSYICEIIDRIFN